jgi:hypothetical protein
VADAALTPGLALEYLDQLSTDIRAAVLLNVRGEVVAASGPDGDGKRMGELAAELFERAEAAAPGAISQVEAWTGGGIVFAVRDERWTLAVVTGRYALSSLMFYDLRLVLADLGAGS